MADDEIPGEVVEVQGGEEGATPEAPPPPPPKEPKPPKPEGQCISPTESGEDLPDGEMEQIILKTLEVLKFCQTKVDEHKIECHSLSFMLLRIKESLDAYYKDFVPKLNTFLVRADKITADYYEKMCSDLPKYGDFAKAIANIDGVNVDVGTGSANRDQLLELVRGVTDNYYAGAMFLKTGRNVYKDVNNSMHDRKEMVCKINTPSPSWLQIQGNVTNQLEDIREQTFKISAYIDFLKQGESKIGPSLDLSPLNPNRKQSKDDKRAVT